MRRARVQMSPEFLFMLAFRDFPRGTEVASVRIDENGQLEFVVGHPELPDVGTDEPPIVRPTFARGAHGEAVFKGWGRA